MRCCGRGGGSEPEAAVDDNSVGAHAARPRSDNREEIHRGTISPRLKSLMGLRVKRPDKYVVQEEPVDHLTASASLSRVPVRDGLCKGALNLRPSRC